MKKIYLLVTVCLIQQIYSQNAGTLDTTFGFNGISKLCGDTTYVPLSLELQSDNKIIFNNYFNTYRYNSNGTVDATYGQVGVLNWSNLMFLGVYPNSEIQQDDKLILYYRKITNTANSAIIARFTVNGQLDTTFNGIGYLNLPNLTQFSFGNKVKIQSDGKIVVVGYSGPSLEFFTVVRVNSNGTLDTTFGINGIAKTLFNAGLEAEATCVNIQQDGKIIVAGKFYNFDYGYDLGVLRFTSSGILDTTFGDNGKVITRYNSYNVDDLPNNILINSDGTIIVSGYLDTGAISRPLFVKYLSNGTLDSTFGTNGIMALGSVNCGSGTPALQIDGKIIVPLVGYYINGEEFKVCRLNVNGSIDTTFGSNGYYTQNFSENQKTSTCILIQPNNKILVGGVCSNDNNSALCNVIISLNPGVILNTTTFNENEITLYPNPSKGIINIKTTNNSEELFTITVYNVLGQTVYLENQTLINDKTINVSNLVAGVYYVTFSNELGVVKKTLLIE